MLLVACCGTVRSGESLRVGLATRDVTPEGPIWLSGYAARNRPSERVDQKLLVQAAAFEDDRGERAVLVSLDNCEVSGAFTAPVLEETRKRFGLPEGAVVVVSSHTHSAPCLAGVLGAMFVFEGAERERVEAYSRRLQSALVEVVGAALEDLAPARLWYGRASAGFAMNRRVFRDEGVDFGENPEGPVDREVPILKVVSDDGRARAVLFGYACHGTTIAGEEFYAVSGDYMAYAREHLEAAFPGAKALYLTGCGADSNPSPRGRLDFARQHGLELAGAVAGALKSSLRPVRGPLRRAYSRLALPLAASPSREKLLQDVGGKDPYVRNRARAWLALLDAGRPLPTTVDYPLGALRLGDDLTFLFLGGEPVVDYALRLKRELALDHPWPVGYSYEVPCYIPSRRILREGGYEADSSLIYYGVYGPLLGRCEDLIVEKMREMVGTLRG